MMPDRKAILPVVLILCCLGGPWARATTAQGDLTMMSMEDLMNIEVYSVAKKPQKLFNAPAAVYVITAEDVRRSGAANIPDLLRTVPGVSVQRVNAHGWDISARGFNNSIFANKMLVLIDGRAVYTPLYGGVFWDVQDVVLEDIERIEVIRGPGGALWGANAVNGVINILTKKAKDTQGTLISAGGGTEERAFGTARYGGHDKGWDYRVYSKYVNRDEGYRATGTANDEWSIARGGFKAEKEKTTVQGDFYEGQVGQRVNRFAFGSPAAVIIDKPAYVQGNNILTKYQDEDWSLQGYWDRTRRDLQILSEDRNTFDLEYNRKLQLTAAQELNWGLGYRLQMEDLNNTTTAAITSTDEADQIFSLFVQDEIKMLDDRFRLIVGSKFEHNIYTGPEVQPSVRAAYDVNERNMVWAAASRAIRTPSRLEEDGTLTAAFTAPSTFTQTTGSHDLSSEEMHSYEVGWRNQAVHNVLLDLSLFANHYDRLITFIPGPTGTDSGFTINTYPAVNGLSGNAYGAELAGDVKIREWWSTKSGYTYTKLDLHTDQDITDVGLERSLEDTVPRHAFFMRSSFNLPHQFELDTTVRYTDSFSRGRVPSVTEMDINLSKTIKQWEVSVVGQNLFRSHHRESVLSTVTQVERGVYAKLTHRF